MKLAHPRIETDARDSGDLAQMMRKGWLPEASVPLKERGMLQGKSRTETRGRKLCLFAGAVVSRV